MRSQKEEGTKDDVTQRASRKQAPENPILEGSFLFWSLRQHGLAIFNSSPLGMSGGRVVSGVWQEEWPLGARVAPSSSSEARGALAEVFALGSACVFSFANNQRFGLS